MNATGTKRRRAGGGAASVQRKTLSVVILSCGGDGERLASLAHRDGLPTFGPVQSLDQISVEPEALILAFEELGNDEMPVVQRARHAYPEAALVVVVAEISRRALRRALAEGVDSVLLEPDADRCLGLVVRTASAGQISLPSEFRDTVAKPALSSREKQILGMVVMGFTNGEIAAKLHLAESTVKSHLSSAFVKLGVRSRNEATALILDPERGLGSGILAISEDVAAGPPHAPSP